MRCRGDAVGQDAPQGGAEDGGHHGHGQDAAEGGGGAGGVQHIEGQGEAEDGVAEQGDDLARKSLEQDKSDAGDDEICYRIASL